MENHAHFGRQEEPWMEYLRTVHQFMPPNLRIGIPLSQKTPRGAIRNWCDNPNAAPIQFCEGKHAMLNKNSIIGLLVVWKETSIDEYFHLWLDGRVDLVEFRQVGEQIQLDIQTTRGDRFMPPNTDRDPHIV